MLLTDKFIPCCCCVPSLRQGHKSKKGTRIARTLHGLVFHGFFFDIIELMILGFGFDLFGFASAGALPFPGVLSKNQQPNHLLSKRECPSTRESKRSKDKSIIKYYRSKMICDDLSVCIGDIRVSF